VNDNKIFFIIVAKRHRRAGDSEITSSKPRGTAIRRGKPACDTNYSWRPGAAGIER